MQGYLNKILRSAIQEIIPKSNTSKVSTEEMDALSQLCTMGAIPTGDENPKEYLVALSDPLLKYLVSRLEDFKNNPLSDKICQFFLIEWCHRQGHLEGDWAWKWDNNHEGHVRYQSKVPLDKIKLPEKQETMALV